MTRNEKMNINSNKTESYPIILLKLGNIILTKPEGDLELRKSGSETEP